MKNLRLCILLIALVLGYATMPGCKKGDAGPAGPAGAAGPAGPDSVQYSAWTALNTPFAYKASNSDSIFTESITAKSITSQVLNQGSVIGYVLLPDPVTGDSSIVNASTLFEEYFTIGYIDIQATSDWSGAMYRYVIIPAKITTTNSSGALQTFTSGQLAQMDYKTVTKVLGIPAKGGSAKL